MRILYNGQIFELRVNSQNSHNEDSLLIASPEEILPHMKFRGGFPDEWCIDLKDIAKEYSIETYKNTAIALIIKENGIYMVYMDNSAPFSIGGDTLNKARENFWNTIKIEK